LPLAVAHWRLQSQLVHVASLPCVINSIDRAYVSYLLRLPNDRAYHHDDMSPLLLGSGKKVRVKKESYCMAVSEGIYSNYHGSDRGDGENSNINNND
jgi:hypothetical protein